MSVVCLEAVEDAPVGDLAQQIVGLSARVNALHCRWLEMVGEFDDLGLAERELVTSTEQWVAWRCAMSRRTAREQVRVARALRSLPAVHAAFAAGALSYSKVRALTKVATPTSESELVEFARNATASQIEGVVRHVARLRAPTPDADDPEADTVEAFWREDGRLEVRGVFSVESGAVLLARLEAAAEALARDELRACGESGSAEPRPAAGGKRGAADDTPGCGQSGSAEPRRRVRSKANRRARALIGALTKTTRHASTDPEDFLVVVHAQWSTLSGLDDAPGIIDGGPALDGSTVRRLCCDQRVALLVENSDGNPLFMGRSTRAVGRKMRRALRARDGATCRVPGCDTTVGVQAHHVEWWFRDGGPTDVTNLVQLCRRHHQLVHAGELRIETAPDGRFRFFAGGRDLSEPSAPPVTVDSMDLEAVNAPWGGSRERLDADHAVTSICSLVAQPERGW